MYDQASSAMPLPGSFTRQLRLKALTIRYTDMVNDIQSELFFGHLDLSVFLFFVYNIEFGCCKYNFRSNAYHFEPFGLDSPII
jgi:hypothetical protein